MVKALIVDDEPKAVRNLTILLEKYCKEEVRVIGSAHSIREAYSALIELRPTLIFLDINMPGGSGLDLMENIQGIVDVKVIFVTAYEEHAIRAFKLSAIDYLLKPVDKNELVEAVRKYKNLVRLESDSRYQIFSEVLNNQQTHRIAINVHDGIHVVDIKDIIYLSSDKNYTIFHMVDGEVVVSRNIGEYEQLLDEKTFCRTHRSFIVNISHIKRFNKKDMKIELSNTSLIEVSKGKRQLLVDKLKAI